MRRRIKLRRQAWSIASFRETKPSDIRPTCLCVRNENNKAQPASGPGLARIRPTRLHVTKPTHATISHGRQLGLKLRLPRALIRNKHKAAAREDGTTLKTVFPAVTPISSGAAFARRALEATAARNNAAVLMTVVNPIVRSLVDRTHTKRVSDFIQARECCIAI